MNPIVVIPTFNERANIGALLPALLELEPAVSVLVVDDNSPDRTAEVVETFCDQFGARVFLERRRAKLGLGTAYVAGFQRALTLGPFDHVIQMDADFSHPPEAIKALLDRARSADVVIGSRYCPGGWTKDAPARFLLSRGAGKIARVALGIPLHDPTGGFKCFTRAALERIDFRSVRSVGFAFQFEVNWICQRIGLRIAEVPIRFQPRRAGRSKISGAIIIEAVKVIAQLRATPAPLPLATDRITECQILPAISSDPNTELVRQ